MDAEVRRQRRRDVRAGVIAAAVYNAQGGLQGRGPLTVDDFFPDPETAGEGEEQDVDSMLAAFEMVAAAANRRAEKDAAKQASP